MFFKKPLMKAVNINHFKIIIIMFFQEIRNNNNNQNKPIGWN